MLLIPTEKVSKAKSISLIGVSVLSMSSRGVRGRRKKAVLNIDLNNMPPSDNRWQEGTSTQVASQELDGNQQGGTLPPSTIDVDAIDDDIIVSSPRAFAEAKSKSRRIRGRSDVVDVESEERRARSIHNNRNKRRRVPPNQTIINCDLYINLEGSSGSMRENVMKPPEQSAPPPSKEPIFNCPICMGPLVEEMSTKCGHIFCKACIKAVIAAQGKCPTCRKKVVVKDLIRVFLPATS